MGTARTLLYHKTILIVIIIAPSLHVTTAHFTGYDFYNIYCLRIIFLQIYLKPLFNEIP